MIEYIFIEKRGYIMEKYEWDLNELNKRKKLILEKLEKEKISEEEKKKYLICLKCLNSMLDNKKTSKFPFLKYSKKELI